MQLKRWVGILLLLVPLSATAAQCPPGDMMTNVVPNLVPKWTAPSGKFGISDMFDIYDGATGTGKCGSCHNPGGTGAAAYVTCSACHKPPYPVWLQFNSHSAVAKSTSYYSPGHTLAQAMLYRATDGSMPPFKDAPGWCDEITAWYQQWLQAGMPL